MSDEVRAPAILDGSSSYVQWGPVFAGSVAAAGLAFVLHAFAASIGVAVGSTSPTWRDASIALWIMTGLYLVLVALVSYGLGGYIVGRLRSGLSGGALNESEFRDGIHGVLVWAIASLITAFLAFGAVQSLTRVATPAPQPAASTGGESIIAYDLDRLFRTERQQSDLTYSRSEAARILLTASGHQGVAADDRAYLIRLVAARTGLQQPEAERRVDAAIAGARENIGRARKSAVIIGFMAGASALLGLVAAWFGACAGGRHRDSGVPTSWEPYMRVARR